MTQQTPTIGANKSGLDYRTEDNAGKVALLNHHKGSSAPSYAEAGMLWLDDTSTPWLFKFYDGTDWITFSAFNATTNAVTMYHGTAALRLANHVADTGSANAYAIAPVPAIAAYATGQLFAVKVGNANTGSSTLAVNGLSAITIKTPYGTNLPVGALQTSMVALFMYDGTNMIYMNMPTNLQGADVASATTVNLDTATGNYVHITGTTTITGVTLGQGKQCTVIFDGALTFTNGASLLLPSAANITTVAGDSAVLIGEASSVVRCVAYYRKDGTALVSAETAKIRDVYNGRTECRIVDDLISFANVTRATSGTGAAANATTSGPATPGRVSLERGATTTGRASIYMGEASGTVWTWAGASGLDTCEWTVCYTSGGTASDGTNNFTTRYGWMDSFTAEPSNGIYFRYNHATNSGNLQCVCREGGVETVINTSQAGHAADVLELKAQGDTTTVEFFIDGTSQGSITTNIPDAGVGFGQVGASIIGSAGTANRLTNIDLLSMSIQFTGAGRT